LTYEAFLTDPAASLEKLLAHSQLPRSREQCQLALDAVWEERSQFRFNKGVSGRGARRFTPAQLARLARQISFYPNLDSIQPALLGG
jgi:hypothetical protein